MPSQRPAKALKQQLKTEITNGSQNIGEELDLGTEGVYGRKMNLEKMLSNELHRHFEAGVVRAMITDHYFETSVDQLKQELHRLGEFGTLLFIMPFPEIVLRVVVLSRGWWDVSLGVERSWAAGQVGYVCLFFSCGKPLSGCCLKFQRSCVQCHYFCYMAE